MVATEELAQGTLVLLEPEEVKTLLERGEITLVDVRNPDEFARARIEGSLLSPLLQFDVKIATADPDKMPVLLCAVGIRSKAAALQILQAGIAPVAHLEGGLKAWIEAGLPVTADNPAEQAPSKSWFSRFKS